MTDPISWGDVSPLISESSCGRGRVVRQKSRFVMFRRGAEGFEQVGWSFERYRAEVRLQELIMKSEQRQGRRAA